MRTRVLTNTELWTLSGTDLGVALPFFPDGTKVIVCEDADGAIVGHLALVPMLHVEGIEVYGAHRGKGVVVKKLLEAMHAEAHAQAARTVFPAAADPAMADLILRLGAVEIPARWFALKVKES